MKRSRISLDFTSLLDIMMIILFSFLISAAGKMNTEADKIREEVEAQVSEVKAQSEQLENDRKQFELEKEEWQKKADSEMEKIQNADKYAAGNAQALLDFQNGIFIEMNLKMESRHSWELTVSKGRDQLGRISSVDSQNIKNEIIGILNNAGFEKDDVIIGIFKYNGGDDGSGWIEKIFKEPINEVDDEYQKFYCAYVDKK